MGFESIVQSVVYQALIAQADIAADSIPVYDEVPQIDGPTPPIYPYIVVGEDTHVGFDTDTEDMNDVQVTVHVWSQYAGKAETKKVQGYVKKALHRARLTGAGYNFINIMQRDSSSFIDADGETRHGVQTFTLLIQETPT